MHDKLPIKAMKQFEKSRTDKKIDKITGYKESSKKDKALDKVVLKAERNAKKKK